MIRLSASATAIQHSIGNPSPSYEARKKKKSPANPFKKCNYLCSQIK